MLAIIRGIIVILYTIIVVTFGMIYCMFSPRNPKTRNDLWTFIRQIITCLWDQIS
ncbi:1-acylglycerol-3-phosphate O-acyltransferase [Proteus mirabilis]|uniref:1-acylglycerol-3-phosphate O-acyltransferase n=1 Tax=Proteus mirabilis TaxID=584 RepID=A0A2X2CCB8_PROMI|nr:1-acylglycerol-3-phosphate O-acyltransferase [Proteus mirabilis]